MIQRLHRTSTGVRVAALAALALLLAGTGGAAAYPLNNLPDPLALAPESDLATDELAPVDGSMPQPGAIPSALTSEGSEVAPGIHRYIVLLTDPPVAEYRGGIGGLAPTAADTELASAPGAQPDIHLDPTTLASESYIRFLERSQNLAINRIRRVAPELKVGWRYTLASNGFSADMTPAHAMLVMRLSGIRVVHPQEPLKPEMDGTARLLGTNLAWESAGGTAEAGLGARLAIFDSGTDSGHPFFSDEGMPPAPAGFPAATMHGQDGTVLNYPNLDELTNNKVIAARVFATEATTATMNVLTPLAYRPQNGDHGLHVGGTAGGRHGTYDVSFGGSNIKVTMGGMAPMAQMLYYVNFASTPGMLAAYDEMLKDKVDVVNISQGHAGWLIDGPENHPIAIAQRAAAAAGLLTVASSGNAGSNGRTSLSGAWKYSDEIMVVGNTTSTGTFNVDGQISGTALPPELQNVVFGPYSAALPATDLEADLYYVATGNGCAVDAAASGKIAVIEYANEAGALIGACNAAARATNMKSSGAVGMVMVAYTYYAGFASTVNMALPTVTIGYGSGTPLVDWLKTGGAGKLTLKAGVHRGYDDKPDILAGSSSRGPGVRWGLKPDISAPGNFIFSSRASQTTTGGVVTVNRTFGLMSGTSMASPHVAGAAALIRSVHPTWSVAKLKSALITTSAPQVVMGPFASLQPAMATDGGPGRLDMRHVLDPGAFLYPQKLSFGAMPEGVADEIPVTIESASDKPETWTIEVEIGGGDGEPLVDPEEITLAPGEKAELFVEFDSADLAAGEHWGHLVFRREGTDQVLRQAYYAFVDQADNRDDVLLINWTYGDTPDYAPYYTKALDDLGLSYTVWNMGDTADNLVDRKTTHPPFSEMFRHDLVILNGNMSPRSLMEFLGAKFQYQNHLLGGGNMLIAGQGTQGFWTYLSTARYADTPQNRAALPDTFPRAWADGAAQNVGCEMCLARYFAGYTPVLTATLSSKLLVPFPMKPAEPEMDVVLAPHPDADGPFSYPLDISTGAKAPTGAAGNQYRLNAGRVLDGYLATLNPQVTRELGDIDYAEMAMEKTIPLARPLWSYPVKNADGEDETLAVGTYVAGRQHSEVTPPVAWNAMYWGFGLEGVGAGAPGSVSQARLLGDTFNFLARNLSVTASNVGTVPDGPSPAIRVDLSDAADEVMIVGTEVDWGDGSPPVKESFAAKPIPAQQFFTYTYAQSGTYQVTIKLIPESDPDASSSAPVYASLEVTAKVSPKGIYLPLLFNNDESLSPPTATPVPAAPTPPAERRRED